MLNGDDRAYKGKRYRETEVLKDDEKLKLMTIERL